MMHLEVFAALFASVAEEMGVILRRSSSSPNIKERLDFSCAAFSQRGELFAQAAHIPVHLGAAPLSVRAAMASHQFRPGDAVLLNDPYAGGTHLPDLTLVSPVFGGQSRPLFYVANRAHHADVGGSTPGSMASCADIYGEGFRIPPIAIVRKGLWQEELLSLFLANVRTPEERRADLQAQWAANLRGVARLEELAQRYRWDQLEAAAEELLQHGALRMEQLLRTLPDGQVAFADVLEDDGRGHVDLKIALTLDIAGGAATLDFSKTADQCESSFNANAAITLSAVLYVFQCLMDDQELAPNEGMARPLELKLRPGSLLAPLPGAAVAAGNVETSQRIVDVVLGALAQVCPDRIPAASQGTMNNLTVGTSHGAAPFSYYETTGGGAGAGSRGDGISGVQVHMTNTRNTPIEALELAYPLRVTRTTLARNSGGRGRYVGGDGIERELELLTDARVSVLSERRRKVPYGQSGGEAGLGGRNWVVRAGQRQERPGKFVEDLRAGDRVGMQTPGGGGWGAVEHEGKEV